MLGSGRRPASPLWHLFTPDSHGHQLGLSGPSNSSLLETPSSWALGPPIIEAGKF